MPFSQDTNGQYVLGYWKIRGLAAPIRMAFAYVGKELKEDVYDWQIDSQGKVQTKWPAIHSKLTEDGTHPFPNLPYLRTPCGELLVQSNAILRHVGRDLGLFGKADWTTMQTSRLEELLEQVNDLRVEAVDNYYAEDGVSESFINGTLPYYYSVMNKCLMKNEGKFFLGTEPTIVDFLAYEVLRTPLPLIEDKREQYEKDYPLVFAFLKAVEALPQLEAYLTSDSHKLTANGPSAKFDPAQI